MPPKQFIKILTIIHASLCGGLLLFSAMAFFNNQSFEADMNTNDVFVYVIPTLAAIGYFASKYLYQRFVSAIQKEDTLALKLSRYQVAYIIQYALVEGPAIVALIAYYWSGNAMHLVITLALIAYLISLRPTREKLIRELPLSFEEKKQFDTLNS